MKGIFLALVSAIALTSAYDDEVLTTTDITGVNGQGCPIDFSIPFYLPDEKYCDLFYHCLNGEPIPRKCPPSTAFNTEKSVCDWIDNVDCGTRTLLVGQSEENTEEEATNRPLFGYDDPSKAQEICAEKDSESILISHEVCSKYYQCNWGRPIVLSCPNNLYYNPKRGYCDWQINVDCKNVGVDDPNWTDAERECSKGKSLVPHEYCNWFYQCGPQGPKEKSCLPGTVFDYELQNCNWPMFVNCGDKATRPPPVEEVTKITEIEPEVIEPQPEPLPQPLPLPLPEHQPQPLPELDLNP